MLGLTAVACDPSPLDQQWRLLAIAGAWVACVMLGGLAWWMRHRIGP